MTAPPQQPLETRDDFDALLAAVTNYEEKMPKRLVPRKFRLERTRALLRLLGSPEQRIPTTHVAGSKGKGSVCRMVAAILMAANRGPVGLYTSPHVEDLAERVMVDGQPAMGGELAHAAESFRDHVITAQGTDDAPTFFEILTAAAWGVFAARQCQHVVLETGLGGRLDATNTCHPTVCAITPIELEHTALLGNTLAAVAGEKAGILKQGVPVVTSARGDALRVIVERAAALQCPVHILGESYDCEAVTPKGLDGIRVSLRTQDGYRELEVPVLGLHQGENAAVAAVVARCLGVSWKHIEAGLASVVLPAAMEVVFTDPLIVLDGAHTARSAAAANKTLKTWWPTRKRVALVAMLRTKKSENVLPDLIAGAHTVVVTQVGSPRAVPAESLAEITASLTDALVIADTNPRHALERATDAMAMDDVMLISGSLYLAGMLRGTWSRTKRES